MQRGVEQETASRYEAIHKQTCVLSDASVEVGCATLLNE